jgi:hypothetical protein
MKGYNKQVNEKLYLLIQFLNGHKLIHFRAHHV